MNKNGLTIKDSALSFILGFFLCNLGVVFATCITLIVYKLANFNMDYFDAFLNTAIGYLILTLSLYFIMLMIFFFYNKKRTNQIAQKVETKKLLLFVLIACLSFFALYPIITCVDSLLAHWGIKLNGLTYELTTPSYFLSMLSLVLAPAVCEELLFRGVILSGLKKHGKIFSIAISAIMFCLFHMSVGQTVYPLVMGLLLGVIMYHTENIYYCIAIHLTNNFLSLTLSYLKINLVFNHWSYIVLALVLFISFVSILTVAILKTKSKTEKIKPSKLENIILCGTLALMLIIWIIVNFA
jgi:membrane protease YdiL (CAAX protease family)